MRLDELTDGKTRFERRLDAKTRRPTLAIVSEHGTRCTMASTAMTVLIPGAGISAHRGHGINGISAPTATHLGRGRAVVAISINNKNIKNRRSPTSIARTCKKAFLRSSARLKVKMGQSRWRHFSLAQMMCHNLKEVPRPTSTRSRRTITHIMDRSSWKRSSVSTFQSLTSSPRSHQALLLSRSLKSGLLRLLSDWQRRIQQHHPRLWRSLLGINHRRHQCPVTRSVC